MISKISYRYKQYQLHYIVLKYSWKMNVQLKIVNIQPFWNLKASVLFGIDKFYIPANLYSLLKDYEQNKKLL